jgi:hypothetical protein
MDEPRILLAHGGGGSLTRELIEQVIVPALGEAPRFLQDAAPRTVWYSRRTRSS